MWVGLTTTTRKRPHPGTHPPTHPRTRQEDEGVCVQELRPAPRAAPLLQPCQAHADEARALRQRPHVTQLAARLKAQARQRAQRQQRGDGRERREEVQVEHAQVRERSERGEVLQRGCDNAGSCMMLSMHYVAHS